MLWEAGEQKTVTDASTLDLMTLTEQYGFRPYPPYTTGQVQRRPLSYLLASIKRFENI